MIKKKWGFLNQRTGWARANFQSRDLDLIFTLSDLTSFLRAKSGLLFILPRGLQGPKFSGPVPT